MLIKSRPAWMLPESAATPESIFRDRRRLVQALAAGPILAGGGALGQLGMRLGQFGMGPGEFVAGTRHFLVGDFYPVVLQETAGTGRPRDQQGAEGADHQRGTVEGHSLCLQHDRRQDQRCDRRNKGNQS